MTYDTINDAVTMAGGEGALLAGRYRVVRPLGQGGMGSVWLAEDTQLDGKQFAIKMLPSILVSNKRAYCQLKDEALVAMKLTHPNIVTLRAFEENNGNPFLVMDYVDGETLDDYRMRAPGAPQSGGLPEEEVVRLLRPIAAALDYAHTKGVVHRDVKPANVMIARDGTPYILDFGIAREIQETMTRVTGKLSSGTLLYMSPEQLNGDPPKPAQDVYSFAAMVYECLKGEPPFVRGVIEDQIKNKVPPSPAGASVPLARSVMSGLAKKPEGRPPTCAAVLECGGSRRRAAGDRSGGAWAKAMAVLALVAALGGGYYAWMKYEKSIEQRAAERKAQEDLRAKETQRKADAEEAERKAAAEEAERKAAAEEAERKAAEERRAREAAEAARIAAERKAQEELRAKEARRKAEAGEAESKAAEERRAREAAEAARIAAERKAQEELRAKEAQRKAAAEAAERKAAEEAAERKAAEDNARRAFLKRLEREGFILDDAANVRAAGTSGALKLPSGESMEMVWCPPGWFMMGSPVGEKGRDDGEGVERRHGVRLERGFWIGKYEVTGDQWKAVMGRMPENQSEADGGWLQGMVNSFNSGRKPVTFVSHDQCEEFCRRLPKGCNAGLPTEAEWEYACRAGTGSAYSLGLLATGKIINRDMANVEAVAGFAETVGRYKDYSNAWGICDMHGNVREWCADGYGTFAAGNSLSVNPLANPDAFSHVVRGGACNESLDRCRCAARSSGKADQYTGFRIRCYNLP